MRWPLVSVIIPNYNGKEFLLTCLESVLEIDYASFEIIIIDDGSTDGSDKVVELFYKYPNLKLIHNEVNKGAAFSRNRGAHLAIGEYLMFLDNDTRVDSKWLKEAINVLRANPSIGIIAPAICDNRSGRLYLGHDIGFYLGRVTGITFDKKTSAGYLTNVPMIGANCFVMRKSTFMKVGGFDSFLNIPYEDSDLCARVRRANFKIACHANYFSYHHPKAKRASSALILREFRNKAIFMARYGNLLSFFIASPLYIIYYGIRALLSFRH